MNKSFFAMRRRFLSLLAVLVCLCGTMIEPAEAADRKAVMQQARQSYYSLKVEGLAGFQCNLTPNWEALLADQRASNPSGVDRAVQRLKELRFSLAVGPEGQVKITHNTIASESEKMTEGLSQIYTGMEQMTSGFFQTWSTFTINPALPEIDAEYRMDEQASQYLISYKDGSADIATTLDQDFSIGIVRVKTNEFSSDIRPRFEKTAKGFLMTGYEATYAGATPEDKTELRVTIDNGAVDGPQLPRRLDLRGKYNGKPFQVEVAFSDCRATRR